MITSNTFKGLKCPYCGRQLVVQKDDSLNFSCTAIKFPIEDYFVMQPFMQCECEGYVPLPIDFGAPKFMHWLM